VITALLEPPDIGGNAVRDGVRNDSEGWREAKSDA
jgi:hypothetical protein